MTTSERFQHVPEATFITPVYGEEAGYDYENEIPSRKVREKLFQAVVQLSEANGVPVEHLLLAGHTSELYRHGEFHEGIAAEIDREKEKDEDDINRKGTISVHDEATRLLMTISGPPHWTARPEEILQDDSWGNPSHYATFPYASAGGEPGAISLYDRRVLDAKFARDADFGDTHPVYRVHSADLLEDTAGILHLRGEQEE